MTVNVKDIYLNYFKENGHVIIPSAPLIPENDPTCLFNSAGIQPLVPYLLGEKHPQGKRLCDVQKCFRLTDIDEVGDSTHHTFFEMLGNWSLGDYFKKESIKYSFDLLTKHFNIPLERLAVTVFKGNDFVDKDCDSANYWMEMGIDKDRIAYLDSDSNWWPNMTNIGPAGPDTEIFYFRSDDEIPQKFNPEDDRWVEIWNNVFMEYYHDEDGYTKLEQKNIDTGMGVERITAILEGVNDNYLSSIWIDLIKLIEDYTNLSYEDNKKNIRIVADHMKAAIMLASEGLYPSNTDQGYILRRIIRRLVRISKHINLDINKQFITDFTNIIQNKYVKYYNELENSEKIINIIFDEVIKFSKTLEKGLKEFNKICNILESQGIDKINGKTVFRLYDTYGFPPEMTEEEARNIGFDIDMEGFSKFFKEHQEKSKAGSKEKFKGGLADNSIENVKYHTATHLLHQALKDVLGDDVNQKGSNINSQRLRFDFSFGRKLTDDEKKKVENIVNEKIKEGLDVNVCEMSLDEAKKSGAIGLFTNKYGDIVKVYSIGNYSKEICGGPHVKNTSELGTFKIIKEEAVSSGVRRIKATLS